MNIADPKIRLKRAARPATAVTVETAPATDTAEDRRLLTECPAGEGWKKWGPYLSERQWGTVREDYSPHGNAWEYFPHDHARSRAYRWARTASPACPTAIRISACRWHCGTGRTRS